VLSAPRKLLTLVVVFSGVMSNVGSEIGYVLLIPLAATIFHAAGRHPITGMAAAFAGVSGGYSANLLLGTIDPLLAGLTQEAAQILDPAARVNPAANYYFMFVSTFLVAAVGTWVTERVVAPRMGEWNAGAAEGEEMRPLSAAEKRGLWAALATSLVLAFVLVWSALPVEGPAALLPGSGFLRSPQTGELLHSPFMSGIVALIFLGGAVTGLAYGLAAGTFRSDADVMRGMAKSMETLGGYMVLVFFAAQFVAYFNWSNLGLIFAVKGAAGLQSLGLKGMPLLLAFVVLAAVINLFMGSASAKWALMAPVFVPMLMLLG
jgi:aminobenzoyl-glutamate transport protein